MQTDYKHTQYGMLMFTVFLFTGILIGVVAWAIISEGRIAAAVIMICIYLFGVSLFYSFTVQVASGKIKFWFGIGLFRKAYPLSEIKSTRQIKNPWYYFWGVKSIPGGWLYAIAPGAALEIVLKNGLIVHVGTDQPKMLRQAVNAAIKQAGKSQPPALSETHLK
jgi:hypothetical protein